MTFNPRPYQQRLHDMTLQHLDNYHDACPLVVAPTASGKSVIVAMLAAAFHERTSGMTLVVTHRKELVEQNAAKLPQHLNASIYSSGLGSKKIGRVTVAGYQSIRKMADKLPKVSTIIIDEAHFATTGYKEFCDTVRQRNADTRIIGLTATPFDGTNNRTALHYLPEDRRIFTGIGAEVSISELLAGGYLSYLTPYNPSSKIDASSVQIDAKTGDLKLNDLQRVSDVDAINEQVAAEICDIFARRKAVMVFGTGKQHCLHIRDKLKELRQDAEVVLGDTPAGERADIIARFRAGKLKYIVACEVLLVGFDAPICDGIANLRTTESALIWVQLCGRGMRLSPETGKVDCLLADFTSTSTTMGPIDEIEGNLPKRKKNGEGGDAPSKLCEQCFTIVLAGKRVCPTCGFEFPMSDSELQQYDINTGLLISGATKNEDGTKTYPVERVEYEMRITRAGDTSIVANYMSPGRKTPVASEYYNLWHHNATVAKRDGEKWLRRCSNKGSASIPLTVQEAMNRAEFGGMRVPKTVTVKPGSPYPVRFEI